MSAPAFSRITGRVIAGGILIALGLLFTLDNFGLVNAGDVFRYWPLMLVGFGLLRIAQASYPAQRVAGGIVVALGIALLLRTLHVVSFHVRDVWPVVFLLGGGVLVWRAFRREGPNPADGVLAGARSRMSGGQEAPDGTGFFLNDFAFLGGGERVVRSQDFRGGEVTAILGGFNIDLRGASIGREEAVLEIFALWGGVELRVPEDWTISMRGIPILGGFSESNRGSSSAPVQPAAGKNLVIKGTAIMGGVEVKH